jgi:NADPH-dependent 2,4-dienoyl-CoA reductase/sulfur reductase-like enzyme/rhodanese-related sulfurtransferase
MAQAGKAVVNMAKRIVIVGGVAAGASAAAKARRTSEDIEIVLIEAGPYISFANCGLPYLVGGQIARRDSLLVMEAGLFARRFKVDVRTDTRAASIDRRNRCVLLEGPNGRSGNLPYDRLVLATGAVGIVPPAPGLDREDVFQLRTIPDAEAILRRLEALAAVKTSPARVVIIGAGYIGLETAEQLLRRGCEVTIIEMADQVMPLLDREMVEPVQAALVKAGCRLILSDALAEVLGSQEAGLAATKSGLAVPFDIGILATGVRPNVELARAAALELGASGAIRVDRFQRTSDGAIYAAGDNSELPNVVLGRPVNIPLAGPANKAGRAAGANAALDLIGAADDDPRRLGVRGVLGTAIVQTAGVTIGVTGLTEAQARREKLPAEVLYMPSTSHATYYPGAQRLLLKLLYAASDGRVLGAQAVGGEGVDKRLDVLATAILAEMTVEDLEQLDLCYAPQFSSAKDPVILAGSAASNRRRGQMPSVTPGSLLEELAGPNPPAVLDVRTGAEYAAGHLDGAINIPVDELRSRLGEVPAERPLAVHCGAGYRSYVAQQILMNLGRRDVRNVLGGYGLIQQVLRAGRKDR